MDAFVNPLTRDYDYSAGSFARDPDEGLANSIYLRLMTPLGSYWPDATFGSNLHLLQREKDVSRVSTLAKQYSEDALQPILVAERATSITVTTSQPHNSRLLLLIEVVDQTGRKLSFNHPVKVY